MRSREIWTNAVEKSLMVLSRLFFFRSNRHPMHARTWTLRFLFICDTISTSSSAPSILVVHVSGPRQSFIILSLAPLCARLFCSGDRSWTTLSPAHLTSHLSTTRQAILSPVHDILSLLTSRTLHTNLPASTIPPASVRPLQHLYDALLRNIYFF
jgi:hypothetical protein